MGDVAGGNWTAIDNLKGFGVWKGSEGELVMAGEVFVYKGYSCRPTVDQSVGSYGSITE